MPNENIIELHGSINLIDIPEFDATPVRVLVVVTHPGIIPRSEWLASCVQQYSGAPIPYQLHLDKRTFEAGEALELEAVLIAGWGEGSEKARVTLPLALDHATTRVEQDITLEGSETGAQRPAAPDFKQITGSVLAANIEDLSGHQLFANLYEVRLSNDEQQVFNQISENVYQMRDLNAPFSLYYDQQVLVSDDVRHDLSFMLQAPSGHFVAGRNLRNIDLETLEAGMQVELRNARS
ncbi:hypothetical protein [Pseudomonas entomophila]|uniref:hypothetical protein n=1 Tax=Pseudomonas entomophila TaxID=312306 RepID=UPI001F02CB2C|nr:hypothetical protein [Pseudomonas entomophila]MCG8293993.1 hypothetical protein [Pseudomonas entomophila]